MASPTGCLPWEWDQLRALRPYSHSYKLPYNYYYYYETTANQDSGGLRQTQGGRQNKPALKHKFSSLRTILLTSLSVMTDWPTDWSIIHQLEYALLELKTETSDMLQQLCINSQWRPHSASLIASSGSLAGPANIAMVTGDMTVQDFTWALRCRRVISSYASQSVGKRLTAARCASGPTSLGAGPSAEALWNLTLLSRLQTNSNVLIACTNNYKHYWWDMIRQLLQCSHHRLK